MFDHVKFESATLQRAKRSPQGTRPLGVAVVSEGPPTYGVELCPEG